MKRLLCAIAVLAATWSQASAQQTLPTLPAASTPYSGAELIYCVQGGVSSKCVVSSLGGGIGTISNLTVTGSFIATGLVTNADLVNTGTTVNGVLCTLGSTCTVTTGASAATQSSPSNPATVSSGTAVMEGLAGAITPTGTGKVLLIVSGNLSNDTGAQSCFANLRYGTGTAPTHGAASTGTGLTPSITTSNVVSFPFTLNAVVTGLTLSTAIWFDVAVAASGGNCALGNIMMSAMEQ